MLPPVWCIFVFWWLPQHYCDPGTITTHSNRCCVSLPKQESALCSPSCSSCVVHFTWLVVLRVFCSQPFLFGFLLPKTSDGQTFFIRVYHTEHWRLLRAEHVESSLGITFPRAGKWYFQLVSHGNRHGHDRAVIHVALDLLCYKDGVFGSAWCFIWHHQWSFCSLWHHCHLGNIVILLWVMHSLQNFSQHIRTLAGTVHSGTVLSLSTVMGGSGDVPLRENFSGVFSLLRVGGHGPGLKYSWKL